MKALLYEYAKNEHDVFTHIDDAIKGQCYSCIECGEPLIIKNGSKKRKHFAHRCNSNCDGESYIHKIWKWRLKDIFYSNSPFIIKYYVCTPCKDVNICPIKKLISDLKCNKCYLKEVDLKQEYDICKEEIEYNGFIGDLVLSDSKHPDKEPLFIEIDYTHSCDEEKIASKIKIIEIKVDDDREKSINLVETGKLNLKFGVNLGNPYDMKHLPPVRFYNFNRLPYPSIAKYSFIKENNGRCELNYLNTSTCKTSIYQYDNEGLEIDIAEDILNSRKDDYYKEAVLALAAKNNFIVRDCRLCDHKIYQDIFHRKCPAMTEKGFSSAQQCHNYRIRLFDVKKMSDRLKGVPYSIRIPKQQ
ncbi:MAG: hypothetical protein J5848_06950 [Bacteroidales bacterium]|nr:hypothetical protein [Bacteroidales bacterium]